MNSTKEILLDQLQNRAIRPSYQRIKILEYLYEKGGHPTVDEIYRALSIDNPSLSRVTVYNTLHLFVEAGMLRVLDIDATETRYDLMLNNHGHFQCEICGKIINFEFDIDRIPIEELTLYTITQKNVYFKGLCPECGTKQVTKKG